MRRDRTVRVHGRALFLAAIVVLMASEFIGVCVYGFVHGRFTVHQVVGLAVVEGGTIFIYMGQRGARPVVGCALLAIGVWGGWHLAGMSHDVSVHSVVLTIQTLLRLAGALVLLGSRAVADYIARLSRVQGGRRRGPP